MRHHHTLHGLLSSFGLTLVFGMLGYAAVQALDGARLANPSEPRSAEAPMRAGVVPDVLAKGLGNPSGALVVGRASVIDGDTLDIRGTRIRLFGIDAYESSQNCVDPRGGSWPGGRVGALALADLIGVQNVSCRSEDIDIYGRVVATCSVGDTDLNRAQVQAGLALAFRGFSHRYALDESEARLARRGGWAMVCQNPADYRAAHPRRRG